MSTKYFQMLPVFLSQTLLQFCNHQLLFNLLSSILSEAPPVTSVLAVFASTVLGIAVITNSPAAQPSLQDPCCLIFSTECHVHSYCSSRNDSSHLVVLLFSFNAKSDLVPVDKWYILLGVNILLGGVLE